MNFNGAYVGRVLGLQMNYALIRKLIAVPQGVVDTKE